MTGGSIVIHQASTGATQVDFQNRAGTIIAASGTLQVGSAATATNFNFRLFANVPNLVIDNTTNNKTATAGGQLNLRGNTLIQPGTALVINGQVCLVIGPTFVNNGTLTGTTAGTRFYFLGGSGPTTYSGSGVVTAPLTQFEVDNTAGVAIAPSTTNSIVATRFNNFSGGLTGSGKLTLGDGAATTAVVQLGVGGVTQTVNGFDVPPVFNAGTGGVILLYAPELTGRTTGNEMPPSRTLTTLGITNPNDITVAGGNVTINGAGAGALALGAARLITGSNVVYFDSAAGTVTRTTGYVLGNFRKSFAAAANKTFEVGTANGYSPADINVTAGASPSDVDGDAGTGQGAEHFAAGQRHQSPLERRGSGCYRRSDLQLPRPAGSAGHVDGGQSGALPPRWPELHQPGWHVERGCEQHRADGNLDLRHVHAGRAGRGRHQLSSDLAITKTDGRPAISLPGGSTTYTIVASNAGIDPATAAIVADTFPATDGGTHWTCVGAGGGTCAANGGGNLHSVANLPVGGIVTFTAICAINPARPSGV